MQLSLAFLYHKLNKPNSKLLLNGRKNPFFRSARLWSGSTAAKSDTVYVCGNSFSHSTEGICGMIWVGPETPPEHCPVLWLKEEEDTNAALCEVLDIFQLMEQWSGMVYDAVVKRKPLKEIFQLLTIVTPNPWYLADPSFRMLVIKDEPDYCEISPIWRYQYAHGHLPIDVVFRMISSGELNQMNEAKEATFYFRSLSFFNGNNFVSKTIFSPNGVIGHFYIIGMYGKPTAYELEIAEFFGNILTDLLCNDPDYMPSTGGFYDYYFIDLLEDKEPDKEMLLSVLDNLRWKENDTYRAMVVDARQNDSIEKTITALEVHLLEEALPCKTFLYHDRLVALVNESQMRLPQDVLFEERTAYFEKEVRKVLTQFDSCAGYSESFQGLIRLKDYYRQAAVALDHGLLREDGEPVSYEKVCVPYMMTTLHGALPRSLVYHPAVDILKKYDEENNTELAYTLRSFLENERNTKQTAQKLFIHRNSLMYRMDRIKELISVDLEDPEVRLRLLISYYATENTQ